MARDETSFGGWWCSSSILLGEVSLLQSSWWVCISCLEPDAYPPIPPPRIEADSRAAGSQAYPQQRERKAGEAGSPSLSDRRVPAPGQGADLSMPTPSAKAATKPRSGPSKGGKGAPQSEPAPVPTRSGSWRL